MRVVAGKQAEALVRKLEKRGATDLARVETQARRIVADVRKHGDPALRRYAEKLDGLSPRQPFLVGENELQHAWASVSEEFRQALKTAAGVSNY